MGGHLSKNEVQRERERSVEKKEDPTSGLVTLEFILIMHLHAFYFVQPCTYYFATLANYNFIHHYKKAIMYNIKVTCILKSQHCMWVYLQKKLNIHIAIILNAGSSLYTIH